MTINESTELAHPYASARERSVERKLRQALVALNVACTQIRKVQLGILDIKDVSYDPGHYKRNSEMLYRDRQKAKKEKNNANKY